MKKLIFGLALALVLASASSASAATCYPYTRDLSLGASGADVAALQSLVGVVMPAGVTPGYFGSLTKTAVMNWQAANMITPAAGYFGPVSRAKAASVCVTATPGTTPGTTPGALKGGDGDFKNFDVMGQPSNEDVNEGEEVEVLGFDFDADDSDLMVERVDFTLKSGTKKPWKFFTEAKLMYNGDEVASIDASDSDEWDETSTSGEYEATFTGVDAVVEEGETGEFTIVVVADDVDDSDLPLTWTISLTTDGVRAVNGDGINVYEGSTSDSETFTLQTPDAGALDITVKSSDNKDQTVEVDADTDTEDVLVYTAELEATDSDLNIEEVTVTLATTTGTVGDLNDLIKTVYLFIDGDEVGSESVSSSATGTVAVTFEDLDFDIDEDDTVDMEVRVDINDQDGNYTDGDAFIVASSTVDYVDALDDDYTASQGKDGGVVTLRVGGVTVELSGNPSYTRVFTADDSGEKDRVEYMISFAVSAFGDEDVYISKNKQNIVTPVASNGGIAWATTSDSTGTTTTSSVILSATGDTSDDDSGYFLVEQDETRTFTLKVTLEAGQDGASGVRLTGINYDTDSSIGTDYYTIDLDDFKVDAVSLNII